MFWFWGFYDNIFLLKISLLAATMFNYFQFLENIDAGLVETLQESTLELADAEKQAIVSKNEFEAFRVAAKQGSVAVMMFLLSLLPTEEAKKRALATGNFEPVRIAATYNHLALIQFMIAMTPTRRKEIFLAENSMLFYIACVCLQDQALREWIVAQEPDLLEEMVGATSFQIVDRALLERDSQFIKTLLGIPSVLEYIKKQGCYRLFYQITSHPKLASLRQSERGQGLSSTHLQEAKNAFTQELESFLHEAAHYEIAFWFDDIWARYQEFCLEQQEHTFTESVLTLAAKASRLDILERAVRRDRTLIRKITEKANFQLLYDIENLEVLQWLILQCPESEENFLKDLLNSSNLNNKCFINCFLWLIERTSLLHQKFFGEEELRQLQKVINAMPIGYTGAFLERLPHIQQPVRDFLFRFLVDKAVMGGHEKLFMRLSTDYPVQFQNAIFKKLYNFFDWVIHIGSPQMLKVLCDTAGERLSEVITLSNDSLLHELFKNFRKQHMAFIMLEYPVVFTRAALLPSSISNEIISLFIAVKRDDIERNIASNPDWDIKEPQSLALYFLIAKRFLQYSEERALLRLNILLSVPSIAAQAQLDDNYLLKTALEKSYFSVARRLATIPHVYELALRQNLDLSFLTYAPELGLKSIAENNESSIRSLCHIENEQLREAQAYYTPYIEKLGGHDAVLTLLRNELSKRYHASPATISDETIKNLVLPLDWDDFQSIAKGLPQTMIDQALTAYYQHKTHTAYRYLLESNPWGTMYTTQLTSQDGPSFLSNRDKELIALFYLAASDLDIPDVDGITRETRVLCFIESLALIARAHNWDHSRLNRQTNKPEKYDDLTWDKRSCQQGVMRRLYESILGHPLFSGLTIDTFATLYFYPLVKQYFQRMIASDNAHELAQAWETFRDEYMPSTETLTVLDRLNFSSTLQQEFITDLNKQLAGKLDKSPALLDYAKKQFELSGGGISNHALKFGVKASLTQLLEQEVQKTAGQRKRRHLIFSSEPLAPNKHQKLTPP